MPIVLNGATMKEIRKNRGLSQEKLAVACDVTARCIQQWEAGTPTINENIAKAGSKRLGVQLEELLYVKPEGEI